MFFWFINLLINFNVVYCAGNITDLSWELNEGSINFQGSLKFTYVKKTVGATADGSWIAFNEFCTSELCGTYITAPYHLYKYGWKVENIPLSHLILPGLIVDISDEVRRNGPDSLLTENHLERWQRYHSPLPEKFILLIRFGWSQYYGVHKLYFGTNPKEIHHPGLSVGASKWIVASHKIVGVGVDVARITPGYREINGSAHKVLAEHQIYGILNLNISNYIPTRGLTLIVMPLKITDGTGSPARVIAISSKARYDIIRGLQTAEYDELLKWYGELVFAMCCFTILLLLICHGLNEFVTY